MVVDFHALNSFAPLGSATIASVERLDSDAAIATASAGLARDLSGKPPFSARPPFGPTELPDVGQLCRSLSKRYDLPRCASRVWRVGFGGPLPSGVGKYALASLRDWNNGGASVVGSHFFGGADGVRWKSPGGVVSGNVIGASTFEVSPLQIYLEGPPQLADIQIIGNTFTACGGRFGTNSIDCSGGLPQARPGGFCASGGLCRGNCGLGVQAAATCTNITLLNTAASSCCFPDDGEKYTCCEACKRRAPKQDCGCC